MDTTHRALNDADLSAHPTTNDQYIVGGAFAYLLRISSVCGLAPLQFKSHANGYFVSISTPMCIYSYALVTITAAITIFGLVSELHIENDSLLNNSHLVTCVDLGFLICIASIGVFTAPNRTRNILRAVSTIVAVDESIDVQYSRAKETKLRAGLTIFMILYWILLLSNVCFYVLQVQGDLRVWLVLVCCVWFSVAWVQVILLELQFSYTAFSIYFRFKAINRILNFTVKDIPSLHEQKTMRSDTLNVLMIRAVPTDVQSEAMRPIIQKSVTGETCLAMPFSDVVHRIATLHNMLSDVAHHITTSYRISLVLIQMSLLLHLIVTPFYFLKDISERISFNYHYSAIMKFAWSIVHLLRLFMLVEPCYYTVTEGNWSKRLVCRLISVSPTTGTLATRLKLFARQLTLQPAAYSPMGFCTLDRPLVTSIFGAVIAYLVLLLQFET